MLITPEMGNFLIYISARNRERQRQFNSNLPGEEMITLVGFKNIIPCRK